MKLIKTELTPWILIDWFQTIMYLLISCVLFKILTNNKNISEKEGMKLSVGLQLEKVDILLAKY